MKREHEDSPPEERSVSRINQEPSREKEQTSLKREKLDAEINLDDIGVGYSLEDRRVKTALSVYQEKLLPFFEENPSLLKKSNYLSIKGYGTGISEGRE